MAGPPSHRGRLHHFVHKLRVQYEFRDVLLLLESLGDLNVDCASYHEIDVRHLELLADAVGAIFGLPAGLRVEGVAVVDDGISHCKIQADAASILQLKELQRHIDESCARMPEKCREVFYLSRREHLSYQHIARQLDISVNTVEKHMVKALKILRSHLKQYHYILFWCLVSLLLLWKANVELF